MKRPYSVTQGYAEDDLDSFMYVPEENELFVVVGDTVDGIYLSIENDKCVFQDANISYENARTLRNYLNTILK